MKDFLCIAGMIILGVIWILALPGAFEQSFNDSMTRAVRKYIQYQIKIDQDREKLFKRGSDASQKTD